MTHTSRLWFRMMRISSPQPSFAHEQVLKESQTVPSKSRSIPEQPVGTRDPPEWRQAKRASAPATRFKLALGVLLTLVVVSSLCFHLIGQQEVTGLFRRRLAAESNKGFARSPGYVLDKRGCAEMLQVLSPMKDCTGGAPTASSMQSSSALAKRRHSDHGKSEAFERQEEKRQRVNESSLEDPLIGAHKAGQHELKASASEAGIDGDSLGKHPLEPSDWPDLPESDVIEGMLLAEDGGNLLPSWLLNPDEEVPLEAPSSSSAARVQEVASFHALFMRSHSSSGSGSGSRCRGGGCSSGWLEGLAAFVSLLVALIIPTRISVASRSPQPSSLCLRPSAFRTSEETAHQKAILVEHPTGGTSANQQLEFSVLAAPVAAWPPVPLTNPSLKGNNHAKVASEDKQTEYSEVLPYDPFYHLPPRDPLLKVKPFEYPGDTWAPWLNSMWRGLLSTRRLLAQPRLNQASVERLMIIAGYLVRLGREKMPPVGDNRTPKILVKALAYRYLLLDAVWAICEAIGPSMMKHSWWSDFAEQVVGELTDMTPRFAALSRSAAYRDLMTRLSDALSSFMRCIRPSLQEAQWLKWAIFCNPSAPAIFKRSSWDAWRSDSYPQPPQFV
ncbi:hypothetical protein Efla_000742 [Eimeria flavescens]